MGYIEGSCVVGMTVSPVLGSILYSLGGFNLPFLSFGSIFLIIGVLMLKLIPDSVDGDSVSIKTQEESISETNVSTLETTRSDSESSIFTASEGNHP